MKYANFIKYGNTISLIAPSFGCATTPYYERLKNACKYFEKKYNLITSKYAYSYENGASTSGEKRANDFMEQYCNVNSSVLWSVGGGELMCQILPYIDFNLIKNNPPKWFIGYSDNTHLTFVLTTLCDIASIYGYHAPEYGKIPIDESALRLESFLHGNIITQEKTTLHEDPATVYEKDNPYHPFVLNTLTNYKALFDENFIRSGRIIGGCLDVLINIVGTKYDNVEAFSKKYKHDGIIWYLENCGLDSIAFLRALWQLREANWFQHVTCFVFGRSYSTIESFDISYENAIIEILKPFNVPIIVNADIGHVPPSLTIINGAIVTIEYSKKIFKLHTELK